MRGGTAVTRRQETVTIAPPDSYSNHAYSDPAREEVERHFVEWRDPLFRYLRTLGCRRPLAEEIAQESFFRLHRALRDGMQVNDARAWVFRVARNLCIDYRREQQRYWSSDRDEPAVSHIDTAIDTAPDPEQQVLRNERVRLIEEQVMRLPKLQRQCMYLKAQGMRYYEIAVALDIPMTAAVDCVRRAVKRLARRFSE